MDCQTALELLEAVRPDSDDMFEPEFGSAAEHVQQCAECSATLRRRTRQDANISHSMAKIPIPSEHKDKLLRLVNSRPPDISQPAQSRSDDESRPVSKPDTAIPSHSRHRRWSQIAAMVVASLLVGWTSWWLWSGRNVDVTFAQLRSEVPLESSDLVDFDESFVAELPFGWEDSSSIEIAARAKGLVLTAKQSHSAALFVFQFPKRGPHAKLGTLVVIPRSRVVDPPSATVFGTGIDDYAQREAVQFELIAWTEGETVYLCFVPAGSRSTLQDLLKTSPT